MLTLLSTKTGETTYIFVNVSYEVMKKIPQSMEDQLCVCQIPSVSEDQELVQKIIPMSIIATPSHVGPVIKVTIWSEKIVHLAAAPTTIFLLSF